MPAQRKITKSTVNSIPDAQVAIRDLQNYLDQQGILGFTLSAGTGLVSTPAGGFNGLANVTFSVNGAAISVPAANVTSGTFGSVTSDAGTYAFSHAVTVGTTLGVTGRINASGGVFISGGSIAAGVLTGGSAFGTTISAQTGATDDFALLTPTGAYIAHVPTGTANLTITNALTVGTTLGVTGQLTASGGVKLADVGAILWGAGTTNIQGTSAGTTINMVVNAGVVASFGVASTALTGTLSCGALSATTGTFSGQVQLPLNTYLIATGGINIGFVSSTINSFNTGSASFRVNNQADNTNWFQITNAGASTFASTLGVTGDFSVNTSKFTVAASSGNTAIAGVTTFGAPAGLKSYTVGTLPTGVQGYVAYCTDLLAPGFLTIAVGGGGVVGPVFYNGSNWVAF